MDKALPEFQRAQFAFTAHVRDPEVNARPQDIEDRRMAIYRNLFYNNIQGFIASGFPVLRQLYNDADWHRMTRDFFAHHRSHTPYFLEISQEFLKYLREERAPQPEDPPFIKELAHYEWVELALSVAEDEPDRSIIDPDGDLLEGRPVLSPLAWLLSYQYPVHRIGPDFRPEAPAEQPTWLLVHRDAQDKLGFTEINPVTARLVALLEESPEKTGRELLTQIAKELSHPQPEVVRQGGAQTLTQLYKAGVVLGTRLA
ncbi:MAG: putative DNA-binding domain-containing protein [Gammaproteobacteria bacterium]|nr:putative DNA-binding domain-containing protein [Gammaproteobacteria bacterium]